MGGLARAFSPNPGAWGGPAGRGRQPGRSSWSTRARRRELESTDSVPVRTEGTRGRWGRHAALERAGEGGDSDEHEIIAPSFAGGGPRRRWGGPAWAGPVYPSESPSWPSEMYFPSRPGRSGVPCRCLGGGGVAVGDAGGDGVAAGLRDALCQVGGRGGGGSATSSECAPRGVAGLTRLLPVVEDASVRRWLIERF